MPNVVYNDKTTRAPNNCPLLLLWLHFDLHFYLLLGKRGEWMNCKKWIRKLQFVNTWLVMSVSIKKVVFIKNLIQFEIQDAIFCANKSFEYVSHILRHASKQTKAQTIVERDNFDLKPNWELHVLPIASAWKKNRKVNKVYHFRNLGELERNHEPRRLCWIH